MKKFISFTIIILIVSSLVNLPVYSTSVSPTVELTYTNPSSNNYTVTVKLKGVTTPFMSVGIDLNYDNTVLSYSSRVKKITDNNISDFFDNNNNGKLLLAWAAQPTNDRNGITANSNGELTLCTVSFTALKTATTNISTDSSSKLTVVVNESGVASPDGSMLDPHPIPTMRINIPVTYTAPAVTPGGGGGGGSPSTPLVTPAPTNTFIDLDGYDWASPAIYSLSKLGIIKGTSENTFSPANNITRADFAVLLSRIFKLNDEVSNNFEDVPANEYFYKPIGILKSLGIAQGSDGNYRPYESITRQDIIVLTHRALSLLGNITDAPDLDILNKYVDKSQISDYAFEPICVMIGRGIIKGNDGQLAPLDNATRAEAAVIFSRIYDILPK